MASITQLTAVTASLLSRISLASGLIWVAADATLAQEIRPVPLQETGRGTLELAVSVDGVEDRFLLDTGAGMLVISQGLFNAAGGPRHHQHLRKIALRLANNRIETTDVYRIESLRVGDCELGPVEAAIGASGSRNLLGLGALRGAAPLSIEMMPPTIRLQGCQTRNAIVAVTR